MKTVSLFFRHPHAIYFSIERLFHTIASEVAPQLEPAAKLRTYDLPFTSKLGTLRKNIRFLRQRQSAVNHITGDAHYAVLGCRRGNNSILTVHDCVLLYQYKKTSARYWLIYWLWYKWPVARASVVTAISENTRQDLIRFTGCDPEKIRVIPNFIDPAFRAVPAPFRSQAPVALFIGTAPNKNLARVIEAISGLGVILLIVGYISPATRAALEKKGQAFEVVHGLSSEEMRQTYVRADFLIFPSLHEGFGLPILEAQATGRPVLTSRREPMLSVAGPGACFVDPESPADIREAVQTLLRDAAYREELVRRGFDNASRFGVKTVADQYLSLYSELLQKKSG